MLSASERCGLVSLLYTFDSLASCLSTFLALVGRTLGQTGFLSKIGETG